MWKVLALLLLLYSCTPKFKETVYKRSSNDSIVFLQQGNPYPPLDEEGERYVYTISRKLQIPIPDRLEIRRFLAFYLRNKSYLERVLSRITLYDPIITQILQKYGLPEELKYLPVVESAYVPFAVSRAGAGGLWQFIPSTAKLYGLKINSEVDERFDIIKSTEAAARHIRDLYEKFGNWELVLAAYNCGAGCAARAGGDFWNNKERLPLETQNYVPSFFAVLLLAKYPHKYGLEIEERPAQVSFTYVRERVGVREILRDLNLSFWEFRTLNPHIKGDYVPPGSYVYYLSNYEMSYSRRRKE